MSTQICQVCKGTQTRISNIVDDQGDVEEVICANRECGWIISRRLIIPRADGTKQSRPLRVDPEQQPKVTLTEENGPSKNKLLSAQQMMERAIRLREETVGKEIREVTQSILEECSQPDIILEGFHRALIGREAPGEIVSGVYSELKELGYKVKKIPDPEKGTWMELKWPTKKTKKRTSKKTKQQVESDSIAFPNEKERPKKSKKKEDPQPKPRRRKEPSETAKKQAAAAAKRKEALDARSKLPK